MAFLLGMFVGAVGMAAWLFSIGEKKLEERLAREQREDEGCE